PPTCAAPSTRTETASTSSPATGTTVRPSTTTASRRTRSAPGRRRSACGRRPEEARSRVAVDPDAPALSRPLRVLSHVPRASVEELAGGLPGGVEIVEVPMEGEPPPGASGEVLLTLAWGSPNLASVVRRGVRWIHTIGTGVERLPRGEVGDRILTCSRGASAIPIAEWTLAMLLAFEKRMPDSWIDRPPERWNQAELGGLAGRTLGLVGVGGIGSAVARRALAFEMR